ncbi:MAG: hypothetical protein M1812_006337 [Candelaria pacifica]|nr:MAG: hypothetical protein M1812_006337 [Candelaria pacifica]
MADTRVPINGTYLEKDYGYNGSFTPNNPDSNHRTSPAPRLGSLEPDHPAYNNNSHVMGNTYTGSNGNTKDNDVTKENGYANGDGFANGKTSQSSSSRYHLGKDEPSDTALHKIKTSGSITISPELFEKMYLTPQTQVKGDLRKTFGNPTPLALIGFLLSLSPLACILMGWRGSGGSGASDVGAYIYMGGMLMTLSGILEFFIGNTFPFVVFCSFGGFWLAFGTTLTPLYNAYGAFSPDPSNPAAGLKSDTFNASFAYFMVFMGLMSAVYLVCALRTNVIFVIIFLTLLLLFGFLGGTYFQLANGNTVLAMKLEVAAGACGFVSVLAGWWIFLAQMLAALDFPFQLPVGDMSHVIPGASDKLKKREEYAV